MTGIHPRRSETPTRGPEGAQDDFPSPCSAHPRRRSCRLPGQPFFPSPRSTGPCSARPGRPSCRLPGQSFCPEPVLYSPVFCPSRAPFLPSSRPALLPRAFCPEPVLYWPVFCPSRAPFLPSSRPALLPRARVVRARVLLHVCPHARTPARLLACASHARPPSRPPASLACLPARCIAVRPPACTNLYHLFPALPARRPCSPARPPACAPPACAPARILMSPAPPWTARPPVAAGPPSCLPPACPSARPPACRPPARPPTRLPACPLSMSHMPTPMPHVRPCVLGGSTHPHLTRAHSRPAPPHRTTAAPPHTYAGVVGVCCGRNNTAPLPPRMGQH